jgi:hypothetical protein
MGGTDTGSFAGFGSQFRSQWDTDSAQHEPALADTNHHQSPRQPLG